MTTKHQRRNGTNANGTNSTTSNTHNTTNTTSSGVAPTAAPVRVLPRTTRPPGRQGAPRPGPPGGALQRPSVETDFSLFDD